MMLTGGQIFKAIPAILADVEAIGKNRTNKQQGFAFRGIDDVMNTLHPLLAKHKVFPTCEVSSVTRSERETKSGGTMFCVTLKAKYTLHAEDGSSVSTEAAGEGMDTADKATNKAMSACYKYAMFQLLCIPTEAVDADEETPEPTKARQKLPVAGRAPDPEPALTAAELADLKSGQQSIASAQTPQDLADLKVLLGTYTQAVKNKLYQAYNEKKQAIESQTAAA
jgi:hypothetical protein